MNLGLNIKAGQYVLMKDAQTGEMVKVKIHKLDLPGRVFVYQEECNLLHHVDIANLKPVPEKRPIVLLSNILTFVRKIFNG